MDWDKKVYPKDIWKWIKDHLPYWPWDITGGIKAMIQDKFLPYARIRINGKEIYRGKNRKGGFTPRRSVSEVDRAYFDTDDFFDALEAQKRSKRLNVDPLDAAHERMKERFRRIDKRMERMWTPITDNDVWDTRK